MNVKRLCALALILLLAACLPSLVNEGTDKSLAAVPATRTVEPTRAARQASSTAEPTLAAQPAAPAADHTTYLPALRRDMTSTATSTATRTPTPTSTRTPVPPSGGAIVANHSVVGQFEQIPKSAIDAAAAKKTLFMHQSTGDIIDYSGLQCLAGLHNDPPNYPQECITYAENRDAGRWPWYDKSNLGWEIWPSPQADAMAKTDQFVDLVHARAGNYQVIGMKYCYVDGWNQSINVEQSYYINKMLALEAQYPGKIFIWATSALWRDPGTSCGTIFNSCEAIAEFNRQVRAYANAHNKPLYDVADIESHDRNGNPCTVQGYEGMCADWYDNSGGHPNTEGAIRLAKGFWWLMARIGGWNGTSSSKP